MIAENRHILVPPDTSPAVPTQLLSGILARRPVMSLREDSTVEYLRADYAQLTEGALTHLVYEHPRQHDDDEDTIVQSVTLTWSVDRKEPILLGQCFVVRTDNQHAPKALDPQSMAACAELFEADLALFGRQMRPFSGERRFTPYSLAKA